MPTTKKRINITLPDETEKILNQLAHQENIPVATKAQQLLQFALELEEDKYFSEMVDKRIEKERVFVSSEEAWT